MIYGPPVWASWLAAAFIVFLSLLMGGTQQQAPTETIVVPIPSGYTGHLENMQVVKDGAGVIFAATRPNSGVGGLVWAQYPDGHTEIVLPIDPAAMYGLGEFQIWPDGYLYYATIRQDDHHALIVIPVPKWTPVQ